MVRITGRTALEQVVVVVAIEEGNGIIVKEEEEEVMKTIGVAINTTMVP